MNSKRFWGGIVTFLLMFCAVTGLKMQTVKADDHAVQNITSGDYYDSFPEAYNAAKSGEELKLLSDASPLTMRLTPGKTCFLLGG